MAAIFTQAGSFSSIVALNARVEVASQASTSSKGRVSAAASVPQTLATHSVSRLRASSSRKSGNLQKTFATPGDGTSPKEYDAELTGDEVLETGVSDVEPSIDEKVQGTLKSTNENLAGTAELKQGLVDSLYGTERGLRASSETRAEIVELIAQLEAANPTEAPTEAAELLNGKWVLAYTSYSELYPVLAAGNLPFVKVGEISQTINTNAGILSNQVTFSNPVSSSTFTTEASFEVRSPKRLQVKFEETVISPPKMSDDVDVPPTVEVFGQTIDVTSFSGIIRPFQDASAAIIRTISGQPPLKVPIRGGNSSWLLTTYLDEDLRISRGDGGGLFVLVKDGSPLLLY